MEFTQADFARLTEQGPEAVEQYARWGEILEKWNRKINLVAPSTLNEYWHRHAYDSWQVTAHIARSAMSVLDMGSGAGFPGLAIAIEMKQRGEGHVTLVESAGKKVNFLRRVISQLELPATVLNARAENLDAQTYDVITARAFAPMPRLLSYAHPFWGGETKGVFLKGQGLAQEIIQAQKDWVFSYSAHQSMTDDMAQLIEVSSLQPKSKQGNGET